MPGITGHPTSPPNCTLADPCHTSTLVWANGLRSAVTFYVILLLMLFVVFAWVYFRKALRACEGDAH